MLKIAICDDALDERENLSRFLTAYLTQNGFSCEIAAYSQGEPLAADYADGDTGYDLIFLDIFMDGIDGMQTAREIRRSDPNVPIIFLTTSPDYALEGYDVRAYGYLVKPLDQIRAAAILEHFLYVEYGGRQKSLLVREGSSGARIAYRDIVLIESQAHLALVQTVQGASHRIYRKLDEIERELSGRGFLRCHQSFLVNLAQIASAEKNAFQMKNGAWAPIRQRDAKKLRDAYFHYLLEQAELTKL